MLWGDPGSNTSWRASPPSCRSSGPPKASWPAPIAIAADTHAPILIYPNPLNPKKYVVINSGFTFREFDYLNNARQIPKLPDYAVVDTTTPPGPRYPGKIVQAGFFNETWGLQ